MRISKKESERMWQVYLVFFVRITICIFSTTISFGQSDPDIPKVNIPTSPEAATISRFGDIPVSFYTGSADISIPLYEIKEGPLSVPITLRYQSSGIKVDDQATWVGLGWNLSPEGTIVQEVRGKSDEEEIATNCETYTYYSQFQQRLTLSPFSYRYLIQYGRTTALDACAFGSDAYLDPNYKLPYEDPYCVIDAMLRGYGVPDIYHYNFGPYSGKFYVDPSTQQIVLIERNEHIFFSKNSGTSITATTTDGTKYVFDAIETSNAGIINEYVGKTYKLTSIKTITDREISFVYSSGQYTEVTHAATAELNQFTSAPATDEKTLFTYHNTKTLIQIQTSDAIINFNLSGRDDINIYSTDNKQKLSSIDIISKLLNKKVKSFSFDYDYFPYNLTGVVTDGYYITPANYDVLGKRLRLNGIKEVGYDAGENQILSKPGFLFEYDVSHTMPMKVSKAKDFWGYFNNRDNTTLLPNLDYFDYFNKDDYKVINQTLSYPYVGANRYADNSVAGAYMLKKIIYPTGGYTQFYFEPNSFSNQFIPDNSMNINKSYDAIDNSITSNQIVQFKLSKEVTIHFENRIANGLGNYNGVTPLTYSQMSPCFIKFQKYKLVGGAPQITVLKQWNLSTLLSTEFDANGGKVWQEELRVAYDPDPDPNFYYQVVVDYPNFLNNVLFASTAGVSSHITYIDDTDVDITKSIQCGMRIKRIKNYSDIDRLVGDKYYEYYDGKLLQAFRPLKVYEANHLNIRGVTGGTPYEYISFYKKISLSSGDFGQSGGNLIGYGKVEETELENEIATNGKKVYYYYNDECQTHQDCPSIPAPKNGLIDREEIYNQTGDVIMEKDYTYTNLAASSSPFVAAGIVNLSTGSLVPCGNLYTSGTPSTTAYFDGVAYYVGSQYGYNLYTIDPFWYKQLSVTTKQKENGAIMLNVTNYTYNSTGQTKVVSTTNSKNESIFSKFYYSTDNVIDPVSDAFLTNHNMVGIPLMTEQYNGLNLLFRNTIKYSQYVTNGPYLPKFFFHKNSSYSEELKMTIDLYDDKGNILQYTEKDNRPFTFIWSSDKTLLLSKIENATHSEVQSAYNSNGLLFRQNLPSARIVSFEYYPLIGLSKAIDENSRYTYYEYDNYNRLKHIKDKDGNIIKKFCYNYAGQTISCD